MPKITIELASPLSNQVGWRKRDFEAISIRHAIDLLHDSFPVELTSVYFDSEPFTPKQFLLFLLNHEDIRRKKSFDIPLKDGDLLQVAIALGGG